MVETMATEILMIMTIAANRVSSPQNQQYPAHDLAPADERCHDLGMGNANLDEPRLDPQLVSEEELPGFLRREMSRPR